MANCAMKAVSNTTSTCHVSGIVLRVVRVVAHFFLSFFLMRRVNPDEIKAFAKIKARKAAGSGSELQQPESSAPALDHLTVPL